MTGPTRDITVDVTIKSDTRGAKDGAAALGDVDKAAGGAGKSMKGMEVDAKSLTSQIDKSKATIKDLEAELTRVGNNPGIRKSLRVERSWLSELEKIGKSLPGGDGKSGIVGALLGGATEAGAAGAKVGAALSGGLVSSVSDALPGPLKLVLIGGITAAASEAAVLGGAILGGAITGAVGTAGMAAGLLSVSKDPAVLQAAGDFGKVLNQEFFGNSKAFVQPAIDGLHILQSELVHLNIGDSLSKLAPTVTTIAHGLANFADNVMPGVDKAFDRSGKFADVAAEGFGGLGTAVGDFADKVSSSPGALKGLDTAFKLTEGAIEVLGGGIHWLSDVYDGFITKQVQIYSVIQGVADGLGATGVGDVANVLRNTFSDIADGSPMVTSAVDAAGKAFQYYEDHVKGAAASTHGFIDSWDELNGKQMSLDETMLAASKAVDNVKTTFETGTKATQGHSQAVLENRVAMEQAAQAAAEAAQAYFNATGDVAGAQKIMDEYKASAEKATGATGGNARAVHDLADQLFKLPEKVNVDVNVTTHYRVTGAQLAKVEDQLSRAGGGSIEPNVPYLINERGYETVTFPAGGTVHPAHLTPMAGSVANGTTNYYSITVNASPLSSPVDVGGAVVAVLKQYENANGNGWRNG